MNDDESDHQAIPHISYHRMSRFDVCQPYRRSDLTLDETKAGTHLDKLCIDRQRSAAEHVATNCKRCTGDVLLKLKKARVQYTVDTLATDTPQDKSQRIGKQNEWYKGSRARRKRQTKSL